MTNLGRHSATRAPNRPAAQDRWADRSGKVRPDAGAYRAPAGNSAPRDPGSAPRSIVDRGAVRWWSWDKDVREHPLRLAIATAGRQRIVAHPARAATAAAPVCGDPPQVGSPQAKFSTPLCRRNNELRRSRAAHFAAHNRRPPHFSTTCSPVDMINCGTRLGPHTRCTWRWYRERYTVYHCVLQPTARSAGLTAPGR